MNLLVLEARSQVALAGGSFSIIGSRADSGTIILADPLTSDLTVVFDPSFNAGGDTIAFVGDADDYTIRLSGSSVIITNGAISASIPVGVNATTIVFTGAGSVEDGDRRALRFVPPVNGGPGGAVVLGDQEIAPGSTPQPIEPPGSSATQLLFDGPFSRLVEENQTGAFVADLIGDPQVVFALSGPDAGLFSIDGQTGIVTFNQAPDFETPGDANGDNAYQVSVSASANGQTITQAVTITVTDVADDPMDDDPTNPGFAITIATGLRNAVAPTATQPNDAGRINSDGEIVTAFGVSPAVLGLVGVDTTLAQVPQSGQIGVSGQNQTIGAGLNNSDQLFGIIEVENSGTSDLRIALENTARVDGTLIIEQLLVNRSSAAGTPVETLTINSGGDREVANVIRDIRAPETQNLVLTGTRDLAITVSELAADRRLEINALALEGEFVLILEGDVLARTSGGVNVASRGSVSSKLVIIDSVAAIQSLSVGGFGDIQFGLAENSFVLDVARVPSSTVEGAFDFANLATDGVPITVTNLSSGLLLFNFSSNTIVNVGDQTAASVTQINDTIGSSEVDNSIALEGADGRDDVTLNLTRFLGGTAGGLLDGPATDLLAASAAIADVLTVSGFANATLNVSRQATLGSAASDYTLDLRLDNARGFDLDAGGLILDQAAADFLTSGGSSFDAALVEGVLETLTITGGATDRADALDVGNALLGSISVIDISQFHGTFTGTVINAVTQANGRIASANVDRTFIIGDDDVDITLQSFDGGTDASVITTNTTFRFTDATPTSGDADGIATWRITNFVLADEDGSSITGTDLTNFSVLNFAGLGLTSFTQLIIEDESGDAVITAAGADWQIILVGVDAAELTSDSENFKFTASSQAAAADLAIAPAPEPVMGIIESFAFA